jgi:cell filamentation protein
VTGDPYCWPGTDCLRNLLGIRDPAELARVEQEIVGYRSSELAFLPGAFDTEHLLRFHHALFRDVYDWAGQIRTVDIAKGIPFCRHQFLPDQLDALFDNLADDTYLTGLAAGEFLEKFARLYGDLNALHPFREGNGRTQRAFLGQLARAAGWDISWRALDAAANVEVSYTYCRTFEPAGLMLILGPLLSPLPAP